MNLFRYCDDDPVDRSDPTGLLSGFNKYTLEYDPNEAHDATHDGWEVRGVNGTETRDGELGLSVDRYVSRHDEVRNSKDQKVGAITGLAAKADSEGIHVTIDVKYATDKGAGPNVRAKAAATEKDHSVEHIKWANNYRNEMAGIVRGMSPADAANRITQGTGRGYWSDSLENRRGAENFNSWWKHDSPIPNPHYPDHWAINPITDKPYRVDE